MEYFSILKMQFHQTMYTSEIEYELMDIDGVRSVNFVQLGQGTESSDLSDYFEKPLWDMTGVPGVDDTSTGTNEGYGWYYDLIINYANGRISFEKFSKRLPLQLQPYLNMTPCKEELVAGGASQNEADGGEG